jgi:HlyD family secretion protein
MPNPKKRKKIWILVAIAVVLVVLTLVAVFKKREPAITVQTDKVVRRNLTEKVVANGKIYPVLQVHISPEVSGEITELAVKEGQRVKKGDLLLRIKPDFYLANLNQVKASYESSLAAKTQAIANLEKAEADFKRNKELFDHKLLSESDYIGFKVAKDVAEAQVESSGDQVNVAKANVASAQDSLDKCTIVAPLDGTITTLNSQLGERVLGTVQNAGTDIMIISDLSQMEARVDIGEMDVVLLKTGQKATLEVDSFKDKKFSGVVTAVANASKDMNAGSAFASSSSSGQTATQFQVRILILDQEPFRPGMSVSAEIETRSRTNALTIPIACVTTRVIKEKTGTEKGGPGTNSVSTNSPIAAGGDTNTTKAGKKLDEKSKPVDVVFVVEGDHVKTVPVKIGISDDDYWEITEGLTEGEEIVTGNYSAISRTLEDGKKIIKGSAADFSKPKP